MKFMKVGSRPDTFYTTESVRSISSEVSSDLIIQVKGTRYLLHKFPLLSKSLHLQRLCSDSIDSPNHQIVQLPDFPGGIESFELCAKFCYGITITISPYNFVSVRCAAEYLQMTEDAEKGNLIYKLEVFFNSCVLKGWKDSIVTLQTTKKELSLWSEDLSITTRCIEAIVSKVILYHRNDDVSCSGTESKRWWWGEDLSEMRLDLYWRIMIAIKSCGKIQSNIVGDALKVYAYRWLTNIPKIRNDSDSGSDIDKESEITSKNRLVLETIVSLIPSEKGSVSCSFLLKLLNASNILNVSSSLKMELAKRVGLQLEEATVNDLLIPSMTCSENDMIYEVDLVMNILEEFMLQQDQSTPTSPSRRFGSERRRSRSAENVDFELIESRRSYSASHGLKLKVAKLVDKYLQEIAKDVNLPLSKFIDVAEIVPEFARHDHDDLYIAVDTYLKVHSEFNKTERKKLCRILDCKKLSMESCMHAAQNELLPLRLVVQVLFIEQARAAASGEKVTCMSSNIKALLEANGIDSSRLSSTTSIQHDDNSSVSGFKSTKNSSLKMKLAEEELDDENNNDVASNGIGRSSRFKSLGSLPNKPKRMFSKFWSTNRRRAEKN